MVLADFLCHSFIHVFVQADGRNCIFNLCRCDSSGETFKAAEPGHCSKDVTVHPCGFLV